MNAITKGQLTRAVLVLESRGYAVRGLRLFPDGSVEVLTADAQAPATSSADDGGDWVDLAGAPEIPRA